MSDYGIKVSQAGYNVGTAADFELLLSSSWPLLKIEDSGTVTVDVAQDSVIATHNLGYPPFFLVFDIFASNSELAMYGVDAGKGDLAVNDTELKFFTDGIFTGTKDIRYYIFRLNLEENFTAAEVNTESTSLFSVNTDYGIKVTKEGKDVTSADLRDYVLHSGTRSPLIHKVETETTTLSGSGSASLTSTHNLGYLPLGYGFATSTNSIGDADPGYWQQAVGSTQAPGPPLIQLGNPSHELSITAFSAGDYTLTIVTLKDPFNISQNLIEVTH